ncbi:MAG: thiaminase II, partial [Candidatus Thermoplasmatota archaeon]|nr:thiaminase II [Candidatus Thermoplasmatota archaeon]
MTAAEQLRRDADDIWQRLLEHPFVTELYSGELPMEAFTFYVLHDYHYLTTAMQNFSIIASKAPAIDEMRAIIDLLHMEAESEYRSYRELVERLGYTLQDAASLEPIPVSVSYGSYLLATSALQSYAEAVTAVLPCFWSY